jgi:hypothetical protein
MRGVSSTTRRGQPSVGPTIGQPSLGQPEVVRTKLTDCMNGTPTHGAHTVHALSTRHAGTPHATRLHSPHAMRALHTPCVHSTRHARALLTPCMRSSHCTRVPCVWCTGTYTVEYRPWLTGSFDVHVTLDHAPVQGSPCAPPLTSTPPPSPPPSAHLCRTHRALLLSPPSSS